MSAVGWWGLTRHTSLDDDIMSVALGVPLASGWVHRRPHHSPAHRVRGTRFGLVRGLPGVTDRESGEYYQQQHQDQDHRSAAAVPSARGRARGGAADRDGHRLLWFSPP